MVRLINCLHVPTSRYVYQSIYLVKNYSSKICVNRNTKMEKN